MTLWVLIAMAFGFLSSFAAKGNDFATIMPLATLAFTLPAFWGKGASRGVAMLAMCAIGFAALAVGTHVGLGFTDVLGPQLLGTPFVMIAVWVAIMVTALTIARSVAQRYRRGIFVVTGMTIGAALLMSLAISPAFFALGLTEYTGRGLYFGVPLEQHLFWIISALVAGVAGFFSFGEESSLTQRSFDGGVLLVAVATGVNTAHHLWLPAVLGLLLLQYAFSLRHTL